MVFQFLLVSGNIIANYRCLGQDAFLKETILIALCSLLQNRRFRPTLESAVLSHFGNRRFGLILEIGGFVSVKIAGFVSFSKSAVLSHLKSAVLSCPHPGLLLSLPNQLPTYHQTQLKKCALHQISKTMLQTDCLFGALKLGKNVTFIFLELSNFSFRN